MNTEEYTAKTLKYSVMAGIAVIVIGLILKFANLGTEVLWAGLLVLIVSPLAAVVVATITLIDNKEWKWVKIAAVLICISAVGMLITILR